MEKDTRRGRRSRRRIVGSRERESYRRVRKKVREN